MTLILEGKFISMQCILYAGEKMVVVKKTVAIHPIIDNLIRKAWARLIESGYNVTYSTVLNLLVLVAFSETLRGWSEETQKLVSSFMKDEETLTTIDFEDHVLNAFNNLLLKWLKGVTMSEAKEGNIK